VKEYADIASEMAEHAPTPGGGWSNPTRNTTLASKVTCLPSHLYKIIFGKSKTKSKRSFFFFFLILQYSPFFFFSFFFFQRFCFWK